jgi:2-oxoisovalerate dehydrogenase E1 component alpha subunit
MSAQMAHELVEPPRDALVSVLGVDGRIHDPDAPRLGAERLVDLYRLMVTNRIVDERMTTLQRQGRIGFYIGALGEEATIIGAAAALEDRDWIFPAYRELGAALVRGFPLYKLVCNLFGNREDPVKGRQMPNHYADASRRIMSISSPVGTQIPQAAGAAWAMRLKKEDAVALVFFGDGTVSQGDFHVGLNFAAVFDAPCIFIIRNNHWAISVPVERQCAAETLVSKAEGYGMAGVRVDGNDLLAVYKVVREAAQRGRAGEGPTLVEAVTYRQGAHSTSDDPNVYRKDSEVVPWRAKDPVRRFRLHLEHQRLWDEAQEEELRHAIEAEVRTTVLRAETVPPPSIETLFEDVYAEMPWHLTEQLAEWRAVKEAER